MSEKEVFMLESEQIDIKSIVGRYLRYWYLFAIGVIISMVVALLYLRYTTPEYSISSTLLIKDDKKGADLSGNVAFNDLEIFQSSKSLDNQIQILKSKSLMQRVLTDLSLYTSFYTEGRLKTTEVFGRSQPIKIVVSELDSAAFNKTIFVNLKDNNSFEIEDGEKQTTHQFGQQIKTDYATFTVLVAPALSRKSRDQVAVKFHDIRKLANSYNSRLTVAPVNKEASVLNISLTDAVPDKGVAIINKLIEVYDKEAVEDKNQIAANTIQFIDDRLKYLTEELTAVEKDVETYKRKNELTDVSSEAKMYLERASEYNRQLSELEIQIDVLNSIEAYLKEQQNQYELVPSTLNIQDATLLNLIAKFNELQLERQRQLHIMQPGNPIVMNINEQLGNLRVNILENLGNIKSSLTITRNNLRANSSQFESRIQKVPAIERELLEINRQQGVKEELYLYLLQKREESALSLAATVSNSRVIDPAMAGDAPVKPKKQLIYLLAFFLGLGVPFAFIYVREMLDDKVKEIRDIESVTATPVLGEISHNYSGETMVVTNESRGPVAELFRLIRANLQFAAAGKENKVILVTSSMSGEGKTFFSINLAASLVLTGKKVVVIGFDLRRPRLSQSLDIVNDIGVSNYLISDYLPVEDIIKPVPGLDGLDIIGSGPIPPNPTELMLLPKVDKLIEELKALYDYIIIDTSPVGQVADALALAPYIDSSIYLVRYNYTHKNQISIVDDIYKNRKLLHPMIVLNDAKKENGYGYGYGYGEDMTKGKKAKKKLKLGV
ncbi:capsular exopolysaccharide synthesis family protein [Pontibacter aydingkolensis]|uniref:non-specific protein-tyrosine kinase n=1 Tax=Pontibacter aydingkolensis TaxID=1911536 RepID=A0ABS7CVZ7_9BACT|nr:tyrosine-protein kinase [Pontibacter aydingkolensis]MBW7467682.1 polysaccharide biosynthesis tyrosine autokinase [Pontibacter aydingkolensis]